MKNLKKRCKQVISLSLFASCIGGYMVENVNVLPVYATDDTEAKKESVIDEGTVWKYLDNRTDPAKGLADLHDWTKPTFDDSSWKSAAGKFGAKKGELASVSGFMPTVKLNQYYENKKNTEAFFFRTEFNIKNIDDVTSLSGKLYHDDEAAVYLNGHQIFSNLSQAEGKTTNLYYSGHGGGSPEETKIYLNQEQCKSYLQEGKNVLSVEVHNDRETSSDIYFSLDDLNVGRNEIDEIQQKSVLLTVGKDEKSKNITWYANCNEPGKIQYASMDLNNKTEFPKKYEEVSASIIKTNDGEYYSNQAELKGLKENTKYVYRLVNKDTVSDVYTFETGDFDEKFNFILAGDPQIGAGEEKRDTVGWQETLQNSIDKLDPDFLLSAGDQVNTASNESQYEGYIRDQFKQLPSATTIGNHDSSSNAYSQHFNLPNVDENKGKTQAGSDYWFVYNNTLFMDINSNNRSTAEHKAFMEDAIKQNPDVRWKTVVFHHSIYSTATHYDDSDIISRRTELPPIFDELGIDVVLMGHDHVYTRTYMMKDGYTPVKSDQKEVTNPDGILYLTANSASGSKYYDIKVPDAEFAACMDQSNRRTITNIEVTDTSYKMTTYYADDMEVLDSFTIHKPMEVDKTKAEKLIKQTDSLIETEYTKDSWKALVENKENLIKVLEKENLTQEELDLAYNQLLESFHGLKKVQIDSSNSSQNDQVSNEESTKLPSYPQPSKDDLKDSSDLQIQTSSSKEDGKTENIPQTGVDLATKLLGMLTLGAIGTTVLSYRKMKK